MKKMVFFFLFLFSAALNSYAAEDALKKIYVDNKNNVHVIFEDGKKKKLTSDGRVSGVKLAPDRKTVMWLIPNTWIAEGDVTPGGSGLAVYHAGKLQSIKCEPFIRDYWFWMDGKQIAIDCGGRHFAGTLILYDAASLRKIESLLQSDVTEEKRPAWTNSERTSDADTAQ